MELVFRYGVASWWQPPAEIVQQLRLAHNLGNALTEIANWHEQAKADHWSSFPEIAAAERDTDTADEGVRQARESVALCRQKAGWHKHQGNADEAAQWRGRQREAQAQLAEARAAPGGSQAAAPRRHRPAPRRVRGGAGRSGAAAAGEGRCPVRPVLPGAGTAPWLLPERRERFNRRRRGEGGER